MHILLLIQINQLRVQNLKAEILHELNHLPIFHFIPPTRDPLILPQQKHNLFRKLVNLRVGRSAPALLVPKSEVFDPQVNLHLLPLDLLLQRVDLQIDRLRVHWHIVFQIVLEMLDIRCVCCVESQSFP